MLLIKIQIVGWQLLYQYYGAVFKNDFYYFTEIQALAIQFGFLLNIGSSQFIFIRTLLTAFYYKLKNVLYSYQYYYSHPDQKMRSALLILVFLSILSISQGQIVASGCVEFSAGVCVRCSIVTHLFEGICYENIIGCRRYQNGSICVQCDESISELVGGTCKLIQNQGPLSDELKRSIYKYGNPGDRYGERNFMPISYDEVKEWPTFDAVNRDIRTGQYGHYISRTGNPVYSVHYYISSNGNYSYKILYEGSGGGIFLLITDISQTELRSLIRSLVVISLTQVVENCIDYDTGNLFCTLCKDGYHLEDGICYANSGKCLRYRQNICLRCLDFHLLVENRCISDCQSLSDLKSIFYYQSESTCSLQRFTGISVSYFYSSRTTTTVAVQTTTTSIVQPATTSTVTQTTQGGSSTATNTQGGTSTTISAGGSSATSSASSSSSSSASSSSSTSSSSSSSSSQAISSSSASSASQAGSSSSVITTSGISTSLNPSISSSFGNSSFESSTTLFNFSSFQNIPSSSFSSSESSVGDQIIIEKVIFTSNSLVNCAQMTSDGNCKTCSFFFYRDSKGICQQVNPLCRTFDEKDTSGACQSCYIGYELKNGECVK